jgi:hypothetical protein
MPWMGNMDIRKHEGNGNDDEKILIEEKNL